MRWCLIIYKIKLFSESSGLHNLSEQGVWYHLDTQTLKDQPSGLQDTQNIFEKLLKMYYSSISGCNMGSQTLPVLAKQGKLPLDLPALPALPLAQPLCFKNEWNLHCEDSAQHITSQTGQVSVLFLPDCCSLPNSLATCNGASGCCTLHVIKYFSLQYNSHDIV